MPSQHDTQRDPDDETSALDQLNHRHVQSPIQFPVVGIGASAGGLDAFKALLGALPHDTGAAFILIQHLDPLHASMLGELLASHTRMPVKQAAEDVLIEPNRVYLIPPGVSLAIKHGKLRLTQPAERHGARMAVDFFLRSLAEDCGDRAICVMLSGSGTDGSVGLRAVKEKGGFVIVQDPAEAGFDGMPKSAIQTRLVDLVLPVARIPGAIVRHINRITQTTDEKPAERSAPQSRFSEILDLVRGKTGQDFSLYKIGTITRRIERRMAMAGVTDAAGYIEMLRANAAELDSLAQDLLINVTQFFRDASAFETLAESVIPDMIAAHPTDRPLRIWTPGCSTGEEVYSLTILFLEAIAASKRNIKLLVFASDVDAHSVAFARAGLYGAEIAQQVSPERLSRFFTEEGGSLRVTRDLRETVVFTVQDLLADPPFSRLDLISCRNVLIYLRADAQERILSLFHFALRVGGVLFLGRSETIGKFAESFEPISKKQRIYRHISVSRPGEVEFPTREPLGERQQTPPQPEFRKLLHRPNLAEVASKLLLDAFAPPSVMVDKKYQALFYSGAVDRYLQVGPGEANRSILVMAREGLRPRLRAALEGARETNETTWKIGAQIQRDGATYGVKIAVQPIPAEGQFLVSFVEEPERAPAFEANAPPEDTPRVIHLEQELDETRKELNAAIRDLEISNEDLRAVNEEALSINEEFQSTNEELETSKEELQSLNEELTALNAQLQETLEQQRATAADLQNILNSSDVATVFLDVGLNIRFFTPAAKSLFGIIGADLGRPLIDLAQRFHDDALVTDARAVVATAEPLRREIESHDGNWYIRSTLPYRINGNAAEGVVITFARISEMKAAEAKVTAARAYAEGIIATVKQPLIVLDEDLRIVSASASFFNVFEVNPEESVGKPFELGGQLQTETLANLLAPTKAGRPIKDIGLTIELPKLGLRSLLLSAREMVEESSKSRRILISIDDVTDAKTRAEALAAAKDEAERANLAKSRFLAAASHDLRQPLQTMSLLQGMLADTVFDPPTAKLIDRLDKTVTAMSGLLDKLLDINQLEAGVVQPKLANFSVADMLNQLQAEFEIHAVNDGLELRVVPCHLMVRSDPRLVEQILRNMLANATKYTNHGKVLLGCRRRGDSLSIEVWDTGSGIPESELSAIFKEFHQLDNRVAKRTKGLGLGLAIVHRLADLLRAPIAVRSRVGHGSVFSLELPVVHFGGQAPPIRALAAPRAPVHQMPEAEAQAILIVEDDAEVRDMLKLFLDRRGFRAFAARDGRQALSIAAELGMALDLIVADYNLPGANGLEVVAQIDAAARRKIPTILLTGDISAATLLEIANKGHIHLHKPADTVRLINTIHGLLGGRKSLASTIFVVDDDLEIREAMRDFLELNGYRAEIFADGADFLEAYSAEQGGCLLADARMPGVGGLQLIEHMAKIQPLLPVIMITAYGDVAMAVSAMKAGAFDFLEKPVQQVELLTAIERALSESGKQPPPSAERVIAEAKIDSLTSRQRQILDQVLAGITSKTIAAKLNISQRTVDNHRAAIMRKTGAKTLSALFRVALVGSAIE